MLWLENLAQGLEPWCCSITVRVQILYSRSTQLATVGDPYRCQWGNDLLSMDRAIVYLLP